MPKYRVLVVLDYGKNVEVEANSEEEAEEKVLAMLESKEIDPLKDFEPNIEVGYTEEIEDEA